LLRLLSALKARSQLNRLTLVNAIATIGVETRRLRPIHGFGSTGYFFDNQLSLNLAILSQLKINYVVELN
jgi:hypothetical protein